MTRENTSVANQADIVAIARGLAEIATGELRHLYMGACPDEVDGHHLRDDDCPACQFLLQHDAIK